MTTIPDFTKRSAEEAKTHELIYSYLNKEGQPQRWEAFALAGAIKAQWTYSLTAERLAQIAEAVSLQPMDITVVQAELTKMVRAKVLRSRMSNGKRLYKVNY